MGREIHVPTEPSVLTWAREAAGLSVADVAKRVHRDEAELVELENGRKRPSLSLARELAAAYRRPMAALLLPEPPSEAIKPADFRVGTNGKLGPEARIAIRRAERLQVLAADLFEALDNPSAWRRGSLDLKAGAVEVALSVRKQLPYSLGNQASWKDEYEALRHWRDAFGATGVLVLQQRMPSDEVRGFSLASEGPITIVLNTSDYVLARIFTLFHELIHQLLGTGGICLPEPGARSLGGLQVAESFCNRVAGNVLVPPGALTSDPDAARLSHLGDVSVEPVLNRLSRKFWVSRQVMWYRLREDELIGEDTYRTMWAQWAARPVASRTSQSQARLGRVSLRSFCLRGGAVPSFLRRWGPKAQVQSLAPA